jgi:hypothetical protein
MKEVYMNTNTNPQQTQQVNPQQTQQIPLSIAEAALKESAHVCMLLDVACRLGAMHPEHTTQVMRYELNHAATLLGSNEHLVTRALAVATAAGIVKCEDQLRRDASGRAVRGRPLQAVILPSLNSLRRRWNTDDWLDMYVTFSTQLIPQSYFKSVREYRRALHYSFVERNDGEQYSRAFLGARLGVSGRTTRNYEADGFNLRDASVVKLEAEERLEYKEIDQSGALELPMRPASGYEFMVAEWEIEVDTALPDDYPFKRTQTMRKRLPLIAPLALKYLAMGAKVWRVKRLANAYHVTYDLHPAEHHPNDGLLH